MEEIFKPVKGFPGYYVSNMGRVQSRKRYEPIFLSICRSRLGYPIVQLWKDKCLSTVYLGRLVLETFVGFPTDPWLCYAHNLNGDILDCRLENLEWIICETTADYDPSVSHRKGVLKPDTTKGRMTEAKKNQKKETIEKGVMNRLRTMKLRYNYNIKRLLDE